MPDASDTPEIRWLGRIAFEAALTLQDETAARLADGRGSEVLFLLEHDPVYTIGRHPDRSSLGADNLPHPVAFIGRGGKATFHGPGQLVGYPILDLRRRGRDLHRYLRFLESVLIDALGELGIDAGRSDGQTGVWVGPRKIASLGVGVRHWITQHGFALNVSNDLAPFGHIIPCGIAGVQMTSILSELGIAPSLPEMAERVADQLLSRLPELGYGP